MRQIAFSPRRKYFKNVWWFKKYLLPLHSLLRSKLLTKQKDIEMLTIDKK